MKRFLVLLTACGLMFAAAACGDDDGDIAVTGETPTPTTEAADDGEATTPTDAETADSSTETDSDEASADGVPTSDDLCAAVPTALEAIYGTANATEAGDGSYPSCDVEFTDATVVVSAYSLDDPLVGGDFDAYIEAVGETVDGLEALEGVGDQAVANETGQAYVLVGDNVVSVSRAFVGEAGDPSDLADVVGVVAEALA